MGFQSDKAGKRNHLADRTANIASAAREHYFDRAGAEAFQRAGRGDQLKGNIHEILFRDQQNLRPDSILKGNRTVLTKNHSACQVDAVTLDKHGKCINRFQLKDCTSKSGVQKTLGQTRSGKYRQTTLVGTKETKHRYDAAKTSGDKEMQSSGTSSSRTRRIADNAGANSRDKNLFIGNLKDIGKCSLASAGIVAVAGGVVSAFSHYDKFKKGKIDGIEYAEKVAVDTSVCAVKAGVTTGTALLLKEGGKTVAKRCGSETLKRVVGSNVGTAVAFGLVEVGINAAKLANGDMDTGEFARKTTVTVSGGAGGIRRGIRRGFIGYYNLSGGRYCHWRFYRCTGRRMRRKCTGRHLCFHF